MSLRFGHVVGAGCLFVLCAAVAPACSSTGAADSGDNLTSQGAGATGGTSHGAGGTKGVGIGGSSTTSAGGTGVNLVGGGGGSSNGGATIIGDPTTCDQAAQAHTYIGCDYWPTVVANNVWSIFDFAVVVANTGSTSADVTVTRGSQTVQTVTVAPKSLQKIYLPWVPELKGPDTDNCGSAAPVSTVGSIGGAYHLVSSVPVTLYQFNALEYKGQGGPPGKDWSSCPGNQPCTMGGLSETIGCFSFSNDASLLLPSTAMTGNYRITGYPGWKQAMIGPYIAITGITDGTSVVVQMSATGKVAGNPQYGIPDVANNGTVQFNINAGDVIELVAPAGSDLSGSLVQATNPVQVIHGMPCVDIPNGADACDHIEETVFPAETLGKHYFVTVPTGPNGVPVGHVVRLYGNVDGTNLTYSANGNGAPTTINAGQVIDFGEVHADFEITGDHEFAVGSFMLGGSVVDPGTQPPNQKGDPSQSLMAAVEQYRNKYVFLAPDDYDVSFADIVAPLTAHVTLDGQPLTASVTAVGDAGTFGVARVQLTSTGDGGAHVLEADQGMGLQVMGYGSYTSYQYPGGLNLGVIAQPPPMIMVH